MPWKRGVAPIRRTLKYLESGPIVFKDRVKVLTVNYNEHQHDITTKSDFPQHKGTQEFIFWTLPQLQYKNPNVQIATFKNLTPSPFITCFLEDGNRVFFDIDGHTKEEIVERLNKTLGKSAETLKEETMASEKKDNPANFGKGCGRWCICDQYGQVPCPEVVPLPKKWRGKYHNNQADDEEAESY